jgi:hypothetical protein
MQCKALAHTSDMSATLAVFQLPMLWPKTDAQENICK